MMKYFLFNYKVLVNDHLLGLKTYRYNGDRMMEAGELIEKIKALYTEQGKRVLVTAESGQVEIPENHQV